MISRSKTPDELACWVALHSAEHVGPATFHRLVRKFGSPREVLAKASAETLQGMPGADAALLESIVFAAIRIDYCRKLIERLNDRGVRIIAYDDADFPEPLRRLHWPPGLLYVQGEYLAADLHSVGIVGSTHASARGFRTAFRSASALARSGYTIVSGNAKGIDTAAHMGALDGGGRTVFVLPEGILNFRRQADMPAAKLERLGVLVSERPPEAPWETEGALARNRITAALSEKLLIVEAQPDDGSMHTFGTARKLGAHAMAVLFSSDTPEGNLAAIRAGALAVHSVAELLQQVSAGGGQSHDIQQSFDLE